MATKKDAKNRQVSPASVQRVNELNVENAQQMVGKELTEEQFEKAVEAAVDAIQFGADVASLDELQENHVITSTTALTLSDGENILVTEYGEKKMTNEQENTLVIGLPAPEEVSEAFIAIGELSSKGMENMVTSDFTNASGETDLERQELLKAYAAKLGLTIDSKTLQPVKAVKPVKAKLAFEYPKSEQLDQDGTMMVSLASLKLLEESSLPDSQSIVRPINQTNVDSMVISLRKGESLPALGVIFSNEGILVYGGRHRRLAYVQWVKELLTVVDGEGIAHYPSNEEVSKALKDAPIRVKPVTSPMTYHDILDLAFDDNAKNGESLHVDNRVKYGLQIISWLKEAGQLYNRQSNPGGVSLGKVAERVGCTPNAFHMQLSRDKKKAEKAGKSAKVSLSDLSDDEQAEAEKAIKEKAAKDESDVLGAACLRLFSTIKILHGQAFTVKQLSTYFTQNQMITEHNLEAVSFIISALQDGISNMPAKK